MPSPSPSPSSPPPPSTQDFQDALASFVDESKPDPLARRQIANLILEWTPSVADPPADETDDAEDHKANVVDNNWESKQLCGTLKVFGDYMVVSINSNCEWRWRPQTKDDDCAHASLTFRLTASAKLIPQSQHKRLQKERQNKQNEDAAVSADGGDTSTEQSPKADRKEHQRAQTKIRSGMINRLQKDYYIKRLLAEATASDDGNGGDTGDQHHHTICEAEIKESFGLDGTVIELEERVDASEDVLEGNVPASPSPEVVVSESHLDDQVIPEDEHESSKVTIEEESRMTNTPEKKKSWMKSLASPSTATSVSENSLLNKSLHSMRALNQRGAQFVANKTMVSRAVSSLNKSLTDLQQIGQELELTIAKRFNQGKVIVLHVILKPASMSRYMEEIRGAVAAEHYQKSMSTLKLLGATETMASKFGTRNVVGCETRPQ